MELDPVLLSRLQFAWLVAFHILLPALTVGLASFIATLEGLHFVTGKDDLPPHLAILDQDILRLLRHGRGVRHRHAVPVRHELEPLLRRDGQCARPAFAYEGLTAFFLEAAFLGVLLFGRKLVPPGAHFVAALMVAFGTLLSSFWILAANSWMQTPAGYEVIDGRFFPTDWLAIIFNPSFPYRIAHTVVAFYITTAFAVVAVGSYLLLRQRAVAEARTMVSITLWLLSDTGAPTDLHR